MAIPARNSNADQALSSTRVFFATTKTSMGRRLFQSPTAANLLIAVLRSCVAARKFQLHDFVVMPDHVHLLMTLDGDLSIEKAMQLIKGRSSYRLKRELGFNGEIWQRGFSESRADNREQFLSCREYIAHNPVKAGLADSPEHYPYCFLYLANEKARKK